MVRHFARGKMFLGILISFVISLASIQPSQVVGQLINDEDSSTEADTSPLNIKKRDICSDEPAYLTPYVREGDLAEARKISRVTSETLLYPQIRSYTGFLTINHMYNSNVFFWYVQVFDDKPVEENPWIIWLQGGPGVTSMDGLFDEVGPFKINQTDDTLPLTTSQHYPDYPPWFLNQANSVSAQKKDVGVRLLLRRLPFDIRTLSRNEFSWCRNHSMVFIDNPLGTGFSYTDYNIGYATDMNMYGIHLKVAVDQLIQIFPELKSAPLFIAGVGYGAKYAPSCAFEMHRDKDRKTGRPTVNLQGLISANGLVDPIMYGKVPQAQYHAGLLTKEDLDSLRPLVFAYLEDIEMGRSVAAKNKYDRIIFDCYHLSGQSPYNIHSDRHHKHRSYLEFINRTDVRAAIHVGQVPFVPYNRTVHQMLDGEFLTSASPVYVDLLQLGYRILAYCGMSDLMSPCYLESELFRKWTWHNNQEFFNATRKYYFTGDTLVGYYKSGAGLTEVSIRKAGHYATRDKPFPIQKLITDWTRNVEDGTEPINYTIRMPLPI